jgi:hypothetical protein
MARIKAEVPWDVEFPQVCARCTAPATKTMRIQRQKPSAQRWFFWFGVIGSAIAGASKGGPLRFEIPYCGDCYRRDRTLLALTWIVGVLSLVFLCSTLLILPSIGDSSDTVAVVGVLGTIGSLLALIIVTPALAIAFTRHKAVNIHRINEPIESVTLAFRSQPYFEHFSRENLEQIVTFSLDHGKELPIPVDMAISVVGRRIDERSTRTSNNLKAHFDRGRLYLRAGMYSAAISDLNRVVAVTGFENPYFLEARFYRGQAYMQVGNTIQAQDDLESYIQAASDRTQVRQAKQWLKALKRM